MMLATRWLKAGGRDVPLLAGANALGELPHSLRDVHFEGRLFVGGPSEDITAQREGQRLKPRATQRTRLQGI